MLTRSCYRYERLEFLSTTGTQMTSISVYQTKYSLALAKHYMWAQTEATVIVACHVPTGASTVWREHRKQSRGGHALLAQIARHATLQKACCHIAGREGRTLS